MSEEQIDRLFKQLTKTLSPTDSKHCKDVMSELLGAEERIMLAKRLATVVLLAEGTSKYKVSRILKLSESTVKNIDKKLRQGHFTETFATVSKTKKDYFAFLKILDDILHLGGILPHYNGLDRYPKL